jgi:hypothetical protein
VTAAPTKADLDQISVELARRRTGMSFRRTRMSADRTLMSVIRTALSLIDRASQNEGGDGRRGPDSR